jgi:hypothetical protein
MAGSANKLDELEQIVRISQMQADIRLKQQGLYLAPRQLFIACAAACGAVVAAVATGIRLFIGH